MKITLLIKTGNDVTSKIVNDDLKLSENFVAREFLLNQNDNLDIASVSQYDIDTLQYIRTLTGKPIRITSVGRSPAYNKKIGGSLESKHQYLFDCLDFIVDTDVDIFSYLKQRGYTGIGRYKGGRYHIDRGYRDKLTVWEG